MVLKGKLNIISFVNHLLGSLAAKHTAGNKIYGVHVFSYPPQI